MKIYSKLLLPDIAPLTYRLYVLLKRWWKIASFGESWIVPKSVAKAGLNMILPA